MTAQLFLAGRTPSAVFSPCTEYRYRLHWPTGVDNDRVCLFVLANPSTATAEQTDPTVSRCINYARSWGFGWCWVVNVRAWRSTDPKRVPADQKGVGPENDRHISEAAREADLVVCGWGLLGADRAGTVLCLIRNAGKWPGALCLTKDGHPRHPLYLRKDLEPFALGWSAFPIGTRAYSLGGGHWTRVPAGWQWMGGDVFPTPGADVDRVEAPNAWMSRLEAQ